MADARAPAALVATGELPACWTPTDQQIMEQLLLEQSEGEDSGEDEGQDAARGSPCTVEFSDGSDQRQQEERKVRRKARGPVTAKSLQIEEERRARHRAVQRRFVQRKKEEGQRTKKLAQDLERKYRFLEISAEKRDLKLENGELQERLEVVVAARPRPDPVQLLIQNQMEVVREFFEPLTQEMWTSVQLSTQREYELSRQDDAYVSSGVSVMGWNDYRKVDDASVKFVLSKGFPNVRALELMDLTWQRLASPSTYASFFSPIFTIKVRSILQVIGRDALVVHRVLYNPQTQGTSHSLELLWRVRLGEEYVIFDAALQNNAAQECLGPSYQWTQMTTALGFAQLNAANGSGCLFRHGGWLRTAVTNVGYWLMEMFFMALRFESTMVSPVFALPPEQ
ncbi:hypothetical protein BBJ28_00013409 [Nothophytophthora sp. Chile5]|nr:hypothetical protein BBJ28_00013409 [Nothophytophthora sp. Chile5]